jgi:PAS domain S-box-containing protein
LKLGVFWEVAFYCLARSNLKEFSPAKPGAYLFLLGLFIAGISCGAIVFYWPSPIATFPTVLIELLPTSGRFFYKADDTGVVTGIVILYFVAVLFIMARYLHSFGTESVRLRIDKEELLTSLQQAHEGMEVRVRERTAELAQVNERLRYEIAERIHAQEYLVRSEERYRQVVDNVQESIFVAQDGSLKFVNQATVELLGYSESELLSRPFTDFIYLDDRELVYQNHVKRINGDRLPKRYSFRILNSKGEIRWVEITNVLIQWESWPAVLVFMMDITDRRKAEERLKESEKLYRDFFATCRDAVFITTLDGRFIEANESAFDILGYDYDDRDELSDRPAASFFVDAKDRDAHAVLVAKTGFCREYPVKLRKKDGTIIDALITTVARKDSDGCVIGFQGTVRDVTDLKRSQEALRQREHQYKALYSMVRLICDNVPDLIWAKDMAGRFTFVNKAMCEKLLQARDTDEPIGKDDLFFAERARNSNLADPHWHDFGELCMNSDRTIIESRRAQRFEEFGNVNGEYLHLDVHKAPLFNTQGEIVGTVGCGRDVTKERAIEQSLHKSEERLRLAMEATSDGIWDWDLETDQVYRNPAFYSMLGYCETDFQGHFGAWQSLVPPEDYARVSDTIKDYLAGTISNYEVEFRVLSKSGEMKWILSRGKIVAWNAHGKPVRMVGTHTDVTDRKKSQEALRESEERYRQITENSLTGVFIHQDGVLVYANQRLAEMLGYTKEEMIGQEWAKAVHPADLKATLTRAQARLRGELSPVAHEFRLLKQTGEAIWCDILATSIVYRGRPAIMGNLMDVSERKRTEEALRTSEAQLADAVEMARLGHWELDVLKSEFTFNDQFYKLFRTTAEQVGGYKMALEEYARRFVHPDEISVVRDENRKAIETDDPYFSRELEHRIFYADGETGHISVRFFIVKDEQGRTVRTYGVNQDITERKKTESALKESEAKYRELVQNANSIILRWNRQGIVTFLNEFGQNFFGYSAEEIVGQHVIGTIVPEIETGGRDLRPLMEEICANPSSFDHNVNENMLKNGRRVWVEWTNKVTFDERSQLVEIFSVGTDITRRKQAEEALRQREQFLEAIFENIPNMIFVKDAEELRFVRFNKAGERLLGLPREELIGKNDHDFFPKEQADFFTARDREILKSGQLLDIQEETIQAKAGNQKLLHTKKIPLYDEKGTPQFVLGISEDITERKKIENALRTSEQRHAAFLNSTTDLAFLKDEDLRYILVNRANRDFFGKPEHEIIGKTDFDLMPHDFAEGCRASDHAALRGGSMIVTEEESEGKFFETRKFPVKLETGSIGIGGIVRDITQLKKAQEDLLQSESRFRLLLEDVSSVPVQGYDEQRRVIFWNSASERVYGYSRDEAFGKRLEELIIPPHMRDEVITGIRNWMERGERIPSGELGLNRKDGSIVPVYSSHVMLENVHGEKEMYCVDLDLTALKKAEEERSSLRDQLREAQKMEAIGTLAGGIAHDFNNILQVTLGYTDLLLAEKSPEGADYADLQKIHESAKSGAELVRSLLTFSRKVEPKLVLLDLNEHVSKLHKLLGRTLPKMIEIRLELATDLARTNADPVQVEQVLMNLAVNARDAMGESGTLTIRTENITLDEEYCELNVEAKPGDYVLLSVSDTGHGMDKATLLRIFEPFYTTKELGRGTGLGLATVYGIVKQHGGHLDCNSEVGKGATFKLFFPATPPIEEPDIEQTGIMPAFGTEAVLLVDDEDFVRELGQRILTRSGYTVFSAFNGAEALEVYEREKDRISLIILDLIMPAMGGKDCLEKILNINPRIKVLVASGYAMDASIKECMVLGAKGFISKPFRIKEMLRQVRKTLDEE